MAQINTIGQLKRLIANIPNDTVVTFCATPGDHFALAVEFADYEGYSKDQIQCGEIVNAFFHAEDKHGQTELMSLDDLPELINDINWNEIGDKIARL